MKYTRIYQTYGNGTKQLIAYRAENGKVIECDYNSGGTVMRTTPDAYIVKKPNGQKVPYSSLREAKQVLETGKSDLDLFYEKEKQRSFRK